jgi:hypothetical protein
VAPGSAWRSVRSMAAPREASTEPGGIRNWRRRSAGDLDRRPEQFREEVVDLAGARTGQQGHDRAGPDGEARPELGGRGGGAHEVDERVAHELHRRPRVAVGLRRGHEGRGHVVDVARSVARARVGGTSTAGGRTPRLPGA